MNIEEYTEMEKDAQKWLDETDTMQFSQIELLVMFHLHQVKNGDLSIVSMSDVIFECGTCGDDTSQLGFCPKCDTQAHSY